MPTDNQDLQPWVRDRNCDLRNALEFLDNATIAKVGFLLSQGTTQLRFRVLGRSNGCVNQRSVDGFVDRGVRHEKEGGSRHQQCVAIHGGEPSVRRCYRFRWVRVGKASHPGPPGRSPDDILSDLEAVLTRIDSSDEEALVRPTIGGHVIRKVH